ncbi:B12-binding domain-containing radical SAM protein [Desulfosarcina ovata subsp. sediminis]|uniref:B12-binding domain-containing radical SAM protein n=1 Tax=Desulfosarcina ovata subsp. sediminis TaxID=885957 RepID=A0A5K7ZHC6_9BACT|nr:lipid biosynthesis B12-binding/radical SAM protein [Desulfosarcina ovata]BBO81608.1 B12-binding domain-containing radical SAM protein [Desulfosarcina ovata subsp. sediminis]
MNVLLISANQLNEPYPVYPLGLDYVAGALADRHRVRILDLNQTASMTDLETAIRDSVPDVVGISLRNADNTDVSQPVGFMAGYTELVQTIRRATAAPVVLGGSGFTIFPTETMEALQADYGIMGEGERLPLLLDALSRDDDPAAVEGVVVRGRPAKTPSPWPSATLRRFDPHGDHLDYYLKTGGILNLQTKRGCPFRCVYCTYPHIEGHRMRLLDPPSIARTAVKLQDAGARYLFVTDSAFNADPAHSIEVARALRKAGLTIPWGAFFAPTAPPPDYFRIMADCGLSHVEFGTESLSNPVLAAYGKPFNRKAVLDAHRMAREAGLHTAHYLLFGGPGETGRTLTETLDHVERLERCVVFMFCGMRIYPHTRLYDLAVAQGQIRAGQNLISPVFYRSPDIDATRIMETIHARSRGRINWVVGAGSPETTTITARMYRKGYSGPLWEYLCR